MGGSRNLPPVYIAITFSVKISVCWCAHTYNGLFDLLLHLAFVRASRIVFYIKTYCKSCFEDRLDRSRQTQSNVSVEKVDRRWNSPTTKFVCKKPVSILLTSKKPREIPQCYYILEAYLGEKIS